MTIERVIAPLLLAQLFVSVVMVMVMAAQSPIDAHPDEVLHIRTAEYFGAHWLPSPVGAAETARAYSPWGMSYVDEADVVYVVLGRAGVLGEQVGLPAALAMRAVQVLLYVALVGWVIARARTYTPALAFLLLTPQVWYVFSYVNGDALPFLLLTVMAIELSWPDSSLRVFLRSARARPTAGAWVFGAMLGLLALSKRNYLVSFGFIGFALVWLRGEVASWRRLAAPLVVAASIAGPWSFYHAWINDFQTRARVLEHSTRIAAPEVNLALIHRPGTSFSVNLRARGVSVWEMLTRMGWIATTYQSLTGVYGWMTVKAIPWVYRSFGLLDAALLALLIVPVAVRGPTRARVLAVGVLAFAALVVGQSAYRSWTLHFQPQGRYLFPMLPMLFFYWRQCEAPGLRPATLVVGLGLGALSLLSYALIALLVLA